MDTNKAAYWIALGVLALGLNGEYQHGQFAGLHRIAERADSALCRVATRAEQTLAVARITVAEIVVRDENLAPDGLLASADDEEMPRAKEELVRDHVGLIRDRVRNEIRARADVIRAQGEVRRAEIEQIRVGARTQVRLVRMGNRSMMVVCPKTGVRVAVNGVPEPDEIPSDEVVDDTF